MINIYDRIKIYKKDSLYPFFLSSYPSTYCFKNALFIEVNTKIVWESLLYIHIPYCSNICKFCNVYKEKINNYTEVDLYLEKLKEEILFFSSKNIKISWIYIWWWTPTLLKSKDIDDLLSFIYWVFWIWIGNIFVEIDASPRTLTKEKFQILNKYWVNQINIWIQSTEESVLTNISRKPQNLNIISKLSELLSDYKFNIHLDFIIWLPWEKFDNIKMWITEILETYLPFSVSINTYDNTIDTILYKEYWELFNQDDYINETRKKKLVIEELISKKYNLKREKTYYFSNFWRKHYNVIWIWAWAFWYINWFWFYRNKPVKDYLKLKNCYKDTIQFNKDDEKIMFIINNYKSETINEDYYNLFWNYVLEDFKYEIDYLCKKWYAVNLWEKVNFNFRNNKIAKFNLILFYSKNIIKYYEKW